MALSGSTDYNLTAIEMIKAAYRAARVLSSGGTLTAADTTDGLEALNILLKAMQSHGLKLWQRKNKSVTLVAAQGTYTLGPTGADVTMDNPVDIISAYLRNTSNIDHELGKLSREDYRAISNKAGAGKPTTFYYDKQRVSGSLSLWLVPDATTAAEYTLELNYRKPIDDLDLSTDDIEIPTEWYHAIKWNLALEIGIENDTPDKTLNRIERMASRALELAQMSDIENGVSISFEPDFGG